MQIKNLTLKEQIQTAGRALSAGVWGVMLGAAIAVLLGAFDEAGAFIGVDFKGVACFAVVSGAAFAFAVIWCALFEDFEL